MNCANCGFPLPENEYVCSNCGASVEKQEAVNADNEKKAVNRKPKKSMVKKRNKAALENGNKTKPKMTRARKVLILIALVIIAALAIVIGIVVHKSSNADSKAPVVYIKENSVMVQTMKGENPFVLTSSFSSVGVEDAYTDYIVKSEDGKNIVYPDSISKDANGIVNYKLYYRDIENENSSLSGSDDAMGVMLSSNVYGIAKADEKFETIVYLKNYDSAEGGKLKANKLKNEIDIDSNVLDFYISDNGKYVLYTKRSGENISLYKCKIKNKNCKPELLKENILSFYILNDKDFSVYAYITSDNVLNYVNKKGEETLVSNDVAEAFIINDSELKIKNLYYYLTSEATYLWKEVLFDDMLEADTENTQPTAEQAAETAKRDAFRKAIADKSMSKKTKALYCFNAESKNKICDDIEEIMLITDNYIVYKGSDGIDLSNVKMSDMVKYDYNIDVASEKLMSLSDVYVRYKTYTGSPINITEDYNICKFVTVSEDKRFFYLAENCSDDFITGDLYRFDTKDLTALNETKIDASVQLEDVTVTNSGAVYYRKNASSTGSADMFVCISSKPTKLIEGIYKIYPSGNSSVLGVADLSNGQGTLYLCEKNKKRKIDTDVITNSFAYRNDGNVFYIKKVSDDASSLYWSKNKDTSSLVSEYVKAIAE